MHVVLVVHGDSAALRCRQRPGIVGDVSRLFLHCPETGIDASEPGFCTFLTREIRESDPPDWRCGCSNFESGLGYRGVGNLSKHGLTRIWRVLETAHGSSRPSALQHVNDVIVSEKHNAVPDLIRVCVHMRAVWC